MARHPYFKGICQQNSPTKPKDQDNSSQSYRQIWTRRAFILCLMLCVQFLYLNGPDHQKRRESHLQPQIHGSFLGREDRVLPSHSMISQGYRTDRGRWRSLTGVRINSGLCLHSLLPLSVSIFILFFPSPFLPTFSKISSYSQQASAR